MKHGLVIIELLFWGLTAITWSQESALQGSGPARSLNDQLERDYLTASALVPLDATATPSDTPTPRPTRLKKGRFSAADMPFSTLPDVPMDHNFMTPVNTLTILPTVVPFMSPTPSVPSRGKKQADNWAETPFPTQPDVPMNHNFMTPVSSATILPTLIPIKLPQLSATVYPTATPFPTVPIVPMSHNYMTPLVTVTVVPMKTANRRGAKAFRTATPSTSSSGRSAALSGAVP